jgi:nicotinate phosphoribosyltransferase
VKFGKKEIEFLKGQKGRTGKKIFSNEFLKWLKQNGDFRGISLRAIPEGRVVHANVPLAVIRGPLAMAQILESSLLNHLNYQTLIATKSARVREAGLRGMTIEFGMRRAQGAGANEGARAALIGGADYTSNTGASYMLGFPPKGTHAHSMVQAFMTMGKGELGAFKAYADVYPDDCLLLVDTVDTLKSGVPNAIKVFKDLKKKGHRPFGIRLDSGDLAFLSIQSAKMLNKAGFADTSIVLSNQLDELVIWQIISQIKKEAGRYGVDADKLIKRLVYGVGTNLITSSGKPALDGVYKLSAFKKSRRWLPAIKVSESVSKIVNPGNKIVWRIYDDRNEAVADLIGLEGETPGMKKQITLCHPADSRICRKLNKKNISKIEPLLVRILDEGRLVYDFPNMEKIRKIRDYDIERLDEGVKRLVNPHIYHVSLTETLSSLKKDLVEKAKQGDFSDIP